MHTPKNAANSIQRYQITEKRLYGKKREDKKNYDLLVAIMVNLGTVPSKQRLLKFLRLIFLDERKAAEKKKILRDEYDLLPDHRETIVREKARGQEKLRFTRSHHGQLRESPIEAAPLKVPAPHFLGRTQSGGKEKDFTR